MQAFWILFSGEVNGIHLQNLHRVIEIGRAHV